MGRSSHILFTLISISVAVPTVAEARKGVAVLNISGPRGRTAARLVRQALRKRFKLVPHGVFFRTVRMQGSRLDRASGRATAARALRISAIVAGAINRSGGRWVLWVAIYSGHSGRLVGSVTSPLRGTRLDTATCRRAVVRIARVIGRTRVGPPPPTPVRRIQRAKPQRVARRSVPAPSRVAIPTYYRRTAGDPGDTGDPDSTVDDGFGFETPPSEYKGPDAGEDEARPRRRTREISHRFRLRRRRKPEPSWRKLVVLSGGLMVLNRSFHFEDPIEPADPGGHHNYRSGVVPALLIEAGLYPLARLGGPLSNLGVVGRYYRALGLKSQLETSAEQVRTTLHTFEAGLRYRWNILNRITSPTLKVGLEIGRLGFVIWDDDNTAISLPDVAHLYLKLALVGVEVPFYATEKFQIGVMGRFDYLIVFSAGQIENPDVSGYGTSSTGGVDAGFGLYGNYRGFFVQLRGFYRRIKLDFDNNCHLAKSGCRAAETAIDVYTGATLAAGYSF